MCVSPLEQHPESVVLTEGVIVGVHGDAFRDPASQRVQINVLLNVTNVHLICRSVFDRKDPIPLDVVRTKVPLLGSLCSLTELDPGKS